MVKKTTPNTTIVTASQKGHRASCEVDNGDSLALAHAFIEVAKDLGHTPEQIVAAMKAGVPTTRNKGPKLAS